MKKLILILAMVVGVVQFASAAIDSVKGAGEARIAKIEAAVGE